MRSIYFYYSDTPLLLGYSIFHHCNKKDVPPYTIAGGVPAKAIRKRFSDDTVSALLKSKWWDWPEEKIQRSISDIQAGHAGRLRDLCKKNGPQRPGRFPCRRPVSRRAALYFAGRRTADFYRYGETNFERNKILFVRNGYFCVYALEKNEAS